MGPCAWQFPGLPQAVQWSLPDPAVAAVPAGAARSAPPVEAGPSRGTLRGKKRKSGPPPGLADERERRAAVEKWSVILKSLASLGALQGKFRPKEADLYIKECAAVKSTQTLHLRAGSWLLYMKWAKDRSCDPYPIDSGTVEEYLRHAAGVAATRGSRFLEAVAFAQYTFGVDAEAAFTTRARGIAATGLKKKRELRQSAPLTKDLIVKWEALVVEAAADPGRIDIVREICRGHFLWLVHTRSRFGDSARVKIEPWLDLCEGQGYIETYAKAGEYKTGHSLKKVGRRFPMVGWATGVSGVTWASAWLKLRSTAGCDAAEDKTLMQEVLASGEFGEGRMTTQDGTLILRALLTASGIGDPESYGTHSAKATLLSWAAKAGLSKTDRKLLGGHTDSKDKSMEEYSRDVLAKPLNALGHLLELIRNGEFSPDATRSGRWLRPQVESEEVDEVGEQESSDTTEKEESAEEVEAEIAARDVCNEGDVYPEMPVGGIWLGSARGCIHRGLGKDTPHAACGYGLKWITATWANEWPTGVHPLCRRASCFPA